MLLENRKQGWGAVSVNPYGTETGPLLWVDAVKGLAILLVVFGHAWRGTWAAGLFAQSPDSLFAAIDARIYAFHMPLFFVVSGFFVLSSLQRYSPARFLRNRATRLVWPLLLWSYIFLLSKIAAGPLANTPVELSWELLFPFPGKWQFWFLWALFLLHISLVVLRPALISDRWRRATLWGMLAISLGVLTFDLPDAVTYWSNNAMRFLPYLTAGMLMSAYGLLTRRNASFGISGVLLASTLILCVPYLPLVIPSQPVLSSALVSMAICLCLLAAMAWLCDLLPGISHGLAIFGRTSMVIFLSHTLFAAPLRIVLIKIGTHEAMLHVLLATWVGLFAPLALKYVVERRQNQALFGI